MPGMRLATERIWRGAKAQSHNARSCHFLRPLTIRVQRGDAGSARTLSARVVLSRGRVLVEPRGDDGKNLLPAGVGGENVPRVIPPNEGFVFRAEVLVCQACGTRRDSVIRARVQDDGGGVDGR